MTYGNSLTRRPTGRQMFRNFVGGFAIGLVGLVSVQALHAHPRSHSVVHPTAITTQ